MAKVKTGELKGITVTTHYPKTDPKMQSDYYDITIDVRGKGWDGAMQYGDYYHDKGYEKAEGYLDAMQLVYGTRFPILKIRIADREE